MIAGNRILHTLELRTAASMRREANALPITATLRSRLIAEARRRIAEARAVRSTA